MFKKNFIKRLISLTVALVMIFSISIQSFAATTIEDYYSQEGQYDVSTITVDGINGDTLMIYYPTGLPDDDYPLITWGNGTWTNPTRYTDLLTHVASHGFIIVCSYNSNQGSGVLMKNAVDNMLYRNNNYYSMFYQKIDTDNIASMGHSQGACGAVNAANLASYIDTVVSLSLVRKSSLYSLGVSCDVTDLDVPTFLVGGEYESYNMAPPLVTLGYYNEMINNNPYQPVIKASLRWAEHNDMMDGYDPDRYYGYITAWLMYQLKDSWYAAYAFEGSNPEISTNYRWIYVDTNNID